MSTTLIYYISIIIHDNNESLYCIVVFVFFKHTYEKWLPMVGNCSNVYCVGLTASCQGYDLQSWEGMSIWWFALRAPWWSHTQWNYSMLRWREREWSNSCAFQQKPLLTPPVFSLSHSVLRVLSLCWNRRLYNLLLFLMGRWSEGSLTFSDEWHEWKTRCSEIISEACLKDCGGLEMFTLEAGIL